MIIEHDFKFFHANTSQNIVFILYLLYYKREDLSRGKRLFSKGDILTTK